jgi:hypothetical protein
MIAPQGVRSNHADVPLSAKTLVHFKNIFLRLRKSGRNEHRTLDGKRPHGWVPEQKITVAEAVRAYTTGSAYAGGDEK